MPPRLCLNVNTQKNYAETQSFIHKFAALHKKQQLRNFNSMIKYPVICGVGLLAGVLSVAAQTVEVSVDGNNYDVRDLNTSFDASTQLLESQPWYGNSTVATAFATAVGNSLGGQLAGSVLGPSDAGPVFVYDNMNDVSVNVPGYGIYTGFVSGNNVGAAPITYATASLVQPVPESTTNPGLLAAAGLFIGWRSWRTVRAARA